jgi:hypothetical protein
MISLVDSLGRAREQAEEIEAAEKAFCAVSKSRRHTFPRWQLGNFYLRHNAARRPIAD